MCTLVRPNKHDNDQYTGYKIVKIIDGNYYSPVMGIKYVEGEYVTEVKARDASSTVPFPGGVLMPQNDRQMLRNFYRTPKEILDNTYLFDHMMLGRTGVFRKIPHVIPVGCKLVRMTVSYNLYDGYCFHCGTQYDIVAGKFIVKIIEDVSV